jgi:hypothetical protein
VCFIAKKPRIFAEAHQNWIFYRVNAIFLDHETSETQIVVCWSDASMTRPMIRNEQVLVYFAHKECAHIRAYRNKMEQFYFFSIHTRCNFRDRKAVLNNDNRHHN